MARMRSSSSSSSSSATAPTDRSAFGVVRALRARATARRRLNMGTVAADTDGRPASPQFVVDAVGSAAEAHVGGVFSDFNDDGDVLSPNSPISYSPAVSPANYLLRTPEPEGTRSQAAPAHQASSSSIQSIPAPAPLPRYDECMNVVSGMLGVPRWLEHVGRQSMALLTAHRSLQQDVRRGTRRLVAELGNAGDAATADPPASALSANDDVDDVSVSDDDRHGQEEEEGDEHGDDISDVDDDDDDDVVVHHSLDPERCATVLLDAGDWSDAYVPQESRNAIIGAHRGEAMRRLLSRDTGTKVAAAVRRLVELRRLMKTAHNDLSTLQAVSDDATAVFQTGVATHFPRSESSVRLLNEAFKQRDVKTRVAHDAPATTCCVCKEDVDEYYRANSVCMMHEEHVEARHNGSACMQCGEGIYCGECKNRLQLHAYRGETNDGIGRSTVRCSVCRGVICFSDWQLFRVERLPPPPHVARMRSSTVTGAKRSARARVAVGNAPKEASAAKRRRRAAVVAAEAMMFGGDDDNAASAVADDEEG